MIEFYKSELYPNIYVLDKTNGGKADALNAGIEYSSNELVVTLDADTIMTDHSLPAINETFEEQNVVAAGGMVHVLQTKTKNPLSGLSLRGTNPLLATILFDIFIFRIVTMVCVAYGSVAYFFNRDWNKVSRTGREYQADSRPAA